MYYMHICINALNISKYLLIYATPDTLYLLYYYCSLLPSHPLPLPYLLPQYYCPYLISHFPLSYIPLPLSYIPLPPILYPTSPYLISNFPLSYIPLPPILYPTSPYLISHWPLSYIPLPLHHLLSQYRCPHLTPPPLLPPAPYPLDTTCRRPSNRLPDSLHSARTLHSRPPRVPVIRLA